MHGLGIDIDKLKLRIRATDYLSVAQIYLKDNFLLKNSLSPDDIKPRLLGHWGTCHGINVAYANLKAFMPDFQFILGPGHGFPALQANIFIDGDLEKIDPKATLDLQGLEYICKNFSWPYGFPSHSSPITPNVILEGGELGYSLGTAYGASLAADPSHLIACLIGDGEMETAALLASLNADKLLDPKRHAKVLPILHLNGYKISGPTIPARKSERELNELLRGFGFCPISVDGEDINAFQLALAEAKDLDRPFLIMKTEKGATGPKELNGEKIAGNYLAHQVPLKDAKTNPDELKALESWLRSYRFDMSGFSSLSKVHEELEQRTEQDLGYGEVAEQGSTPKISKLVEPENLPNRVDNPGSDFFSPAKALGLALRDYAAEHKDFYFFSPDETTSNKLDAIFEATDRAWNLPTKPWDKYLSPEGRVVEMLSENTLFSMMQGHVLSGHPATMTSYEAFFPIVSSQLDQYLKFLDQSIPLKWRKKAPALNLLSTSTCWRQDHNGFSHQNPSLISDLLLKPSNLVNCLFPVDDVAATATWEFMAKTKNVVNLATFNKTDEPRWIDFNHARFQLTNGGASIFQFASDDNPDIILTAAGDIVSREALYAIKIVKQSLPHLRLRFVGLAALSSGAIGTTENKLLQSTFNDYFTTDKPILANFHGYPETLKSILTNYANSDRLEVHGFIEKGSTTTPFDMLARNKASRFDLALSILNIAYSRDLIDTPTFDNFSSNIKIILEGNQSYAKSFGLDLPSITAFQFP